MENKQKICDLLLPALQETRSLNDLIDLEYIQEQGIVLAVFPTRLIRINVMGDSGIAMIKDVVDMLMYGKERKKWIVLKSIN